MCQITKYLSAFGVCNKDLEERLELVDLPRGRVNTENAGIGSIALLVCEGEESQNHGSGLVVIAPTLTEPASQIFIANFDTRNGELVRRGIVRSIPRRRVVQAEILDRKLIFASFHGIYSEGARRCYGLTVLYRLVNHVVFANSELACIP